MIAEAVTNQIDYFWGRDLSGGLTGAGGVGGLLAVSIDGAFYFPLYDHNGNITDYVSSTGNIVAHYEYDAFGNTIFQTGSLADTFSFRFSTKYFDPETGFYYYGYRYYIPSFHRWLTRDPIEEKGGVNLYGFCGNNPIVYYDNDGRKIRVEKDGNKITVVLNITIYYANNNEKRANTNLDRIAQRIKRQIESHWNRQTWNYECCTISFRANVSISRQVGTFGLENDNLIAITTDPRHRSYVVNASRGVWTADNRPGTDWRFAHEAGHLMGLDDDYVDDPNTGESIPSSGHDNHMMARWQGIVDVHEVMDIIRLNNISCGNPSR